ncbi:hypothetical protein GUITHDRAFT_104223 [Guillardia theta CCMP2712]|uniref:Ion transport domain-containing protein n=1 Tax=Guillardia theta (strain CCMP2712) TaxID=905079 RepID=L1JP55_GUITC|nr:hypothetical protein GUITHDRAFT_104223 [Guillardia theta CCMP2712]EKX49828.1 hypothetical protein GUITHDRAFT_104223 [Guillardia theta CCMP2712]|eukprot:XP_005836808.1 hypothetical protein GUITHDRAFT_104223 [Guillardia theta CCMP2712]
MAFVMRRMHVKQAKAGAQESLEALEATATQKMLLETNFRIADIEGILYDEVLEKMSAERRFQKRRVILTRDKMMFCRENDAHVKEFIPLAEIALNGERSSTSAQDSRMDLLNEDSPGAIYDINTEKDGFNSGRTFTFRLCKEQKRERARAGSTAFQRFQAKVAAFYSSNAVQGFVAVLIFANFIANAIESEIKPAEGTQVAKNFSTLDLIFTILFTIELCLNLLASWFWPFVQDGWSMFDLVVVTVSLLALVLSELPGVNVLRLMRAFRVMRLFGRLASLRLIINSLCSSIVPVLNAFLIMLLITSIYAILAVNFFGSTSPEYFGTFTAALLTMFQVCTVDPAQAKMKGMPAVFFVSFIVIVGWTLLQVVVAVLLDNFTAAADREKERIMQIKAEKNNQKALDIDDSNTVNFSKLREGLRKFKVELEEDGGGWMEEEEEDREI